MKTNAKIKKTTTNTKAVSAKKMVKPVAKKTVKPIAKVTAKKTVSTKTVVKPAAKTVKKAVAPAKKAPAKAIAVKSSAKKSVAKVAPKTAPKANKIAVKKVKPLLEAKKSTKSPVKALAAKASVPAKNAAKPAAKITAIKPAAKTSSPVTAMRPIMVKMPQNQNMPVRTPLISTVRPSVAGLVPSKDAATGSANNAMARPVYRPIQVTGKSLTPAQPVRQMAPVSKADEKVEFKKGDHVVYPAHGLGTIEAVETHTIGGVDIKLYAIAFEKDRMRLKVPVFKAHASGLRRLSSANQMQDALKTLQGRAQIRRAMWSRRAQEYETKINSGNPVFIAEVLRDLKRSTDESEQSYSERQIYQSALERLAREVAAVEKISEAEASDRLESMIKSRKARAAAANADDVASEKEVATA